MDPGSRSRCSLGRNDKRDALPSPQPAGISVIMPRLFAILLFVLSATAAHAQATQGGRAPYESDLQRLSEILGALHYLRDICGAREGQIWRNEMQALLDAEA